MASRQPAVRIEELALAGFRNLREVHLQPSRAINVLLGANGAGKTSVLEAVDYLASLSSFRGAGRSEVIGHQIDRARLRMMVVLGELRHEYRIELGRGARQVLLDGKKPEHAVEYYGNAACVVFQPGDLDLVRGSPELRRRLLDRVLIRIAPGYGENLKSYGRALRARNRILRDAKAGRKALGAYNELLIRYGSRIVGDRAGISTEIQEACDLAIGQLGLDTGDITVSYRTGASGNAGDYQALLEAGLETDLVRGSTRVGPHGDDLALRWKGRAARVVASQGQARALALALRLAELEVLRRRAGFVPMLLLDDVSSELDRDRTLRLFEVVESLGAQVWVTTTDPAIAALVPGARQFHVHAGEVEQVSGHAG